MDDSTEALDRRAFLARGVGVLLLLPVAGALAACGDSSTKPAAPAPGAPPAAPPPAAPPTPAAPPPAASAAPAPAPDALVSEIAANAGLVASLQYVNASTVAGQECAGCQLYTAGSADRGKCALFPVGLVAAKGHCTSWVKKQA